MSSTGKTRNSASQGTQYDGTRAFYHNHAREWSVGSLSCDLSSLYGPFVSRLSPAARVLDLGAGPGRDTMAFRRLGFFAVAVDICARLLAEGTRAGLECALVGDMLALPFQPASFHGVWACASLLHLDEDDFSRALGEVRRVLHADGLLFLSVKEGEGSAIDEMGRYSRLYRATTLTPLCQRHGLHTLQTWFSEDLAGRSTRWLNLLLQRPGSTNDVATRKKK